MKIGACFIAAIIVVSLVSRLRRSFELRVTRVELDATAERFVRDCARRTIRLVANEPGERDHEEYADKSRQIRRDLDLPAGRGRRLRRGDGDRPLGLRDPAGGARPRAARPVPRPDRRVVVGGQRTGGPAAARPGPSPAARRTCTSSGPRGARCATSSGSSCSVSARSHPPPGRCCAGPSRTGPVGRTCTWADRTAATDACRADWTNDLVRRPADAGKRLGDAGYLADPATATTTYLAGALEKPLLVEGPAGVGKTELAKAIARATGCRPGAAAVLRGPRRGAGAVRVELQEAAAPDPGRSRRPGVGRDPRRHLHRRVPADPAAADRDPARGADGAADRRGRQDRRRGRGPAAGGAQRLPGHDPRAGHDQRRTPPAASCSPRTRPASCPRR